MIEKNLWSFADTTKAKKRTHTRENKTKLVFSIVVTMLIAFIWRLVA